MCAFPPPKDAGVVPALLAPQVIAFLRGKPTDPMEHALEGAATEAHSRYRSPTLRAAALKKAAGLCAACGVDFRAVANGLGERCLVVHHKKQLKDYDEPKWTSASDLAVVSTNCHMMIHTESGEGPIGR